MITRSEWRRGMRAWWVFVGVMSSVGCYRHRRIEPTTLTRSSNARPETVEVTLRDETWVRLGAPELRGERIEGAVTDCAGRGCEEARRARGVSVRDAVAVEVRESAPGQTAVGLVAVGVVVAVVFGVIFAMDFNPLGR